MSLNNIATDAAINSQPHRENYGEALSLGILNHIRTLLDRAAVYSSAQDDVYGIVYSSASGTVTAINDYIGYDATAQTFFVGDFSGTELDSGNIDNSTSVTETTGIVKITNNDTVPKKITTARYDRTSTVGSTTINFFNGDSASSPIHSISGTNINGLNEVDVSSLGICILPSSSITMSVVASNSYISADSSGIGPVSLNNTTIDDASAAGVDNNLAYRTATGGFAPFSFVDDAGPDSATPGIITMSIPTGTFSTTSSAAIAKIMYDNWESGVTTDIKVTSASDDSGYFSEGLIEDFTAFSAEPDEWLIKLTPASTPTSKTPSIKGAGLITR